MTRITRLAPVLVCGFSLVLSAAEPIQSFPSPFPTVGSVERLDPALDALLSPDARMEKLGSGFRWSEGPVWLPKERMLVFSDVPTNTAYRWKEGEGIREFLKPSGFTGDRFDGREPGSNGLTLDRSGRLVLAQHGDRRVARLETDGRSFVTLAERFEGKRFSSPNDVCYDEEGRFYFTDPPYGLPNNTPPELPFNGVYRVDPDGTVNLLTKELERPNGIALSPDERTLYIANSFEARPILLAVELDENGRPGKSRVFFDTRHLMGKDRPGVPDGLKVDRAGNLWATGPGGVLILDAKGKHLGTLLTGQPTANCAFGEDGSTLFITSNNALLRIRTRVPGSHLPAR